ncbi:hypothetical protein [Microvirga sesbaniae]|uniref:hypothetical protein n=1 Tax=Microvirga sesbaniae TaxID=681392 RepID=UPI0021C89000|nr:hypothetical protein [Microvirga sp. HBU67692]
MKLAAHGLCLFLLALPFAARASEDLVAKREACRIEARSRIVPKRKIQVDDYRRIVERRAAYVTQCLSSTVVARSSAPLPPQRVLDDAADGHPDVVPSGRDEPGRTARASRRDSKAAAKPAKAAKPKARKARVSSRRGR